VTKEDRLKLVRMAAEIEKGVALAESSMPDVGVSDVKRQALAAARADAETLRRLAAEEPAPLPGDPRLEPHQQRVVAERYELEGKLSRLVAFLETQPAARGSISVAERDRLRAQAAVMRAYVDILAARIEAWEDAPKK
jgi:hypothetical protein